MSCTLLTLKSNFSANAGVLRRYLTERLEAEPGKQLPLLHATADFLRNFNENISRYQAPARSDAGNSAGDDFPALAMLQGNISDSELCRLADRFSHGKSETDGVCLNGPFDFESGIFYLTNIFAGNGRAFARYFLGQPSLPQSYLAKQSNKDVLDVHRAPFIRTAISWPQCSRLAAALKRATAICSRRG